MNSLLDNSAVIEIDTADAAADKTADHGLVIRCAGGDGAGDVSAIEEGGILGDADKTGGETLSGHVTGSGAVVEGGGAGGIAGETAHITGLGVHRGRRRAGRVSVRYGGIADKTARIVATRRDRQAAKRATDASAARVMWKMCLILRPS